MKKYKIRMIILVVLSALLPPSFLTNAEQTVFPKDERTQRIIKQEAIISEGNSLVEQGLYSEALAKFREALAPSVLNEEYDKGRAIYFIEKVYKLQGKYEESLKELQWSIDRHPNPQDAGWLAERLELLALIQSRDTRSPQPIYDHIKYLREKYRDQLPPKSYGGYADTIFSTTIRLYDHIADYDAGIALIDEFLEYGYARNKNYVRVNTPSEALQHGYKAAAEFLKIREAFLEDQKENRSSCINQQSVCIGRATKALIQSDYFPW